MLFIFDSQRIIKVHSMNIYIYNISRYYCAYLGYVFPNAKVSEKAVNRSPSWNFCKERLFSASLLLLKIIPFPLSSQGMCLAIVTPMKI